jgi:hypothetical protein
VPVPLPAGRAGHKVASLNTGLRLLKAVNKDSPGVAAARQSTNSVAVLVAFATSLSQQDAEVHNMADVHAVLSAYSPEDSERVLAALLSEGASELGRLAQPVSQQLQDSVIAYTRQHNTVVLVGEACTRICGLTYSSHHLLC